MDKDDKFKYEDEDIYAFFNVSPTAELIEIQRSYRKLCLTCHPDKFPGDKAKETQFLKLTAILDYVSDPAKRKTYDSKRRAKEIHLKRKLESDARTRKFREDLESRENAVKRQKQEKEAAVAELQREIIKLREEGLRKVEEEKAKQKLADIEARRAMKQQVKNSTKNNLTETYTETYAEAIHGNTKNQSSQTTDHEQMVSAHKDFEAEVLANMMRFQKSS